MKVKNPNNKLIGQVLIDSGLVTREELEQALTYQQENGGYLCTILTRLGKACGSDIFRVLGQEIGFDYCDLGRQNIDSSAVAAVPVKIAWRYLCLPYAWRQGALAVVLADPCDVNILDDLSLLLDKEIIPALGIQEDIERSIRQSYGVGADIIDNILLDPETEKKLSTLKPLIEDLDNAQTASIIAYVNQLFLQALKERATDIHIEPFQQELRIRFRIDGFLYTTPIPADLRFFHQAIVSRIKVMANLDLAERRLSQDGRIKIKTNNSELDLRVSLLPSYLGESVQIRLLSSKGFLDIAQLGLLEDDLSKIQELIDKANGIIFVTGPTGSGKSTTLYSCLNRKNLPDTKIITAEDPVEYQMQGITQIQTQGKIGLTFAACLRSILRHDPDMIMVGEVRDPETAEITIRAAMTGHLVFSTLHTNDASSAPARLIDMGIEPFLVASSLAGVIAQRLVRVICPACKKKEYVDSSVFIDQGIDQDREKSLVYRGLGCEHCRYTGFSGRTAIFEIMLIDDEIRNLILHKASSQAIKDKAGSLSMRTLRQSGLLKVLQGVTTLNEVMRVS